MTDDLREAVLRHHATPSFDLITQPWLPVTRSDGTTAESSLGELLSHAHEIHDLAEPHPIVRAATRRFLGGLTADLVRRASDLDSEDWQNMYEDNRGFPPDLVEATLEAHRDFLWLWHPTSPFLQDMRLMDSLTPEADWTVAVQELVPELPGESTGTWFVKPGDRQLLGSIHPSRVARLLMARWWYALPGNCGPISVHGTRIKYQSGGTFTEGRVNVTHVWRVVDMSVFRTLLRNLTPDLVTGTPGAVAWTDLDRPTTTSDELYLATTTATATLLADNDETGHPIAVLRGPIAKPSDVVKGQRELALDRDPHRIRSVSAKGKKKIVRIPPSSPRFEILRRFYRDGIESTAFEGVASSSQLWLQSVGDLRRAESFEMLMATKAGASMSPVLQDVGLATLPAGHLDPTQSSLEAVRGAVAFAFDPKNGIANRLANAARSLLKPADPTGQVVQGHIECLRQTWGELAADLLTRVLDGGPAADTDWQEEMYAFARQAFEQTFRPYASSTRYAAAYAQALRYLYPGGNQRSNK